MRTLSALLIVILVIGCTAPSHEVNSTGQAVVTSVTSPISVDIRGDVLHPEAYSFPAGTRLAEAIDRAGGFGEWAARNAVLVRHRDGTMRRYNLLHPGRKGYGGGILLQDGDMVDVPRRMA